MSRILVAMSGGVDSSVAAALLCGAATGDEVIGVTLHLWDYPDDGEAKGRCCAPEDIHDARRVCDRLGIPYYAFDRRELFERTVVAPFVEGYLGGQTPSPCVHCNRGVKIPELLSIADTLGAERVATGHYARIDRTSRAPRLLRGKDRQKDQSYFLHMLGAATLDRLLFPLGELDKDTVRQKALEFALPGATKGESQELCFVPTGRYDAFVDGRAEGRAEKGSIVDQHGRKVGEHDGVHRFTVGQRKNLGVALGERAYVVGLDAESGTVTLGSREDLLQSEALLDQVTLACGVALPLSCEVSVRYRGVPVPARVEAAESGARVLFQEPVQAVVPGQFAVFYSGDAVLGGGVIQADRHRAGKRLLVLQETAH
jgi:tRNA-specific 2-thiouridylase